MFLIWFQVLSWTTRRSIWVWFSWSGFRFCLELQEGAYESDSFDLVSGFVLNYKKEHMSLIFLIWFQVLSWTTRRSIWVWCSWSGFRFCLELQEGAYESDFLDLVSGFVLNYKKEHMSLIFLIWFQVLFWTTRRNIWVWFSWSGFRFCSELQEGAYESDFLDLVSGFVLNYKKEHMRLIFLIWFQVLSWTTRRSIWVWFSWSGFRFCLELQEGAYESDFLDLVSGFVLNYKKEHMSLIFSIWFQVLSWTTRRSLWVWFSWSGFRFCLELQEGAYESDFLDLVSGFVLNYKKEHMSLMFLIWFQVLSWTTRRSIWVWFSWSGFRFCLELQEGAYESDFLDLVSGFVLNYKKEHMSLIFLIWFQVLFWTTRRSIWVWFSWSGFRFCLELQEGAYASDFLDLVSGFVLNYKKEHMSLIFLIWFQVLSWTTRRSIWVWFSWSGFRFCSELQEGAYESDFLDLVSGFVLNYKKEPMSLIFLIWFQVLSWTTRRSIWVWFSWSGFRFCSELQEGAYESDFLDLVSGFVLNYKKERMSLIFSIWFQVLSWTTRRSIWVWFSWSGFRFCLELQEGEYESDSLDLVSGFVLNYKKERMSLIFLIWFQVLSWTTRRNVWVWFSRSGFRFCLELQEGARLLEDGQTRTVQPDVHCVQSALRNGVQVHATRLQQTGRQSR